MMVQVLSSATAACKLPKAFNYISKVAIKTFSYVRTMSEVVLTTNFIPEKMVVQESLVWF